MSTLIEKGVSDDDDVDDDDDDDDERRFGSEGRTDRLTIAG